MAQELTIGKVAKLAEVHVETIRYYQRRGLLAEPDKPYMGYRRYSADIVKRIRFIKRAQALGFTLNEVAVLMKLEEARACGKTRALALDKINAIDQKLTGLTSMRKALAALVRQCEAGESSNGCPIIRVLEQSDSSRTAPAR
ncbi:MAG: MerR family transcriptional regulator [Nitrospira sp.]|nr:MerR family transcriptional regulator [Nitrospira sp.]